ncbi:MAG: SusC/RagA family TonB-linked outer membrane protein [Gemmatimonadota bacterium]
MNLSRVLIAALVGGLLLVPPLSAQNTGTVAGSVLNASTMEPVSGATVAIADVGGITNQEGRFLVTGVPAGTHTLRVSQIGYAEATREVSVAVGETVTLEIALTTEAIGLGELVVTSSYTREREGDLTGVVETVQPEQFNPGRNVSPQQLIQGKVAGVEIHDSGEPGGGISIRVRGGTSINASNEPLFVIDGVPVPVGGGISAGRNPLNFLNPNDIANMTVLKDASATAIYGSRGANGVILIETFSGRGAEAAGGSQLTYSGNISASTVAVEPNMLTNDQFIRAVTDHAPSALDMLADANTDWRDAVQRDAVGHDHSVALAGASGDMDYRLSVGYTGQEGVLHGTETERATVGINYGQNFFGNDLRVSANLKGSHAADTFTPGGVIGNANIFAPTQPIYDEDSPYGGFYEWGVEQAPVNPVAQLELIQDDGTTLRSLGDLEAQLDIPYVSGLTGTVRTGYDVIKTNRQVFRPTILFNEARQDTLAGYVSNANNTQYTRLLDAFVNYSSRLAAYETDIDITAGYSYEDSRAEYPFFEAWGLEFDYLGTDGIPSSKQQRQTDWTDEHKLISFFGRANVTLMDRYLLTFNLRRDGSSRFGPEEQWGIFPSAALAWRISNESFMEDLDVISDLKLRASWGVNGNQAFANYQQYSTYTLGESTAQYLLGNTFVPTIRPSAADPGIKWEETTSLNFGIDFGILDNRFSGSVDYYFKETDDLIFRVPVAAGTNLSNFVTTNIGAMENRGFELTLDARIFEEPDGLWWTAGFNVATNMNELVRINPYSDPSGGTETILTGGISGGVGNFIQVLTPGQPVNSFFVYRHRQDENGLPVWEDTNGDGTINEQDLYVDQNGDGVINEDDRVPYKSPDPDWTFGLTSNLGYGPFDASLTMRASIGNYVYNNVASNLGHYRALQYVDVPNNLHQSVLETGFEREQYFSDYYVEDASFLRLDNLTVGYTFTPATLGGEVRVYGTTQNLFTLTEYRGVDPTAGVNGIDNNLYPRSRTFTLGATVQF